MLYERDGGPIVGSDPQMGQWFSRGTRPKRSKGDAAISRAGGPSGILIIVDGDASVLYKKKEKKIARVADRPIRS